MWCERVLAITLVCVCCVMTAAAEDKLPPPSGPVILEVTGNIDATNDGSRALFDIDALKKIGTTTIETTTPWMDGKVTFEGLSAAALMTFLGAEGAKVKATAVDDYSVVIPMEDFEKRGAMIAYEMNGEPLPQDMFGPLWVVFPYDSNPAIDNDAYYSRSIWRLKKLTIE